MLSLPTLRESTQWGLSEPMAPSCPFLARAGMGVGTGGALGAASLHPCPSLEDCMWSDWSSWTHCSCKVLVQQRYRHQGPAPGRAEGGAPCTRLDGHFRPCTIGNCSGKAQG